MAARRANFTTDFLLQELLRALGVPLLSYDIYPSTDSFSESLSEETESQHALERLKSKNQVQSRVMIVRRTNSSQQTITLVDRMYEVTAYLSRHVIAHLQQERGYETLGRLCGSVIRVTKYHFATLRRCLRSTEQQKSVSVPNVGLTQARVYLWIDALAIVEDNDLAVKPLPLVDTHPLVAKRLDTLNDADLEKQLMINQGLIPLENTRNGNLNDARPLLEEDCVIPEEQEQELEEQNEWGPPTTSDKDSTDLELTAGNGSMRMSDAQTTRDPTLIKKLLSTQESMVSSESLSMTSANLSTKLSENPLVQWSEETSITPVLDTSQRYVFQQEDIQETFVVGSDSEGSDSEGSETSSEHSGVEEVTKLALNALRAQTQAHPSSSHSVIDSYPAPTTRLTTQKSWMVVDLADDSSEQASMEIAASKKKPIEETECKSESDDIQHEATDNTASPSRTQYPTEKQTPSAKWTASLFRMIGLGTSAAAASPPCTQVSDEDADDMAENDQNATQIVDLRKKKKDNEENETKAAQSDDLVLSQTTVVLQYDVNSDDDAHAFEYEGMLSDDIVSPGSAEHGGNRTQEACSASSFAIAEKKAECALKKKPALGEDATDFATSSFPAQAVTAGTKKRTESADPQTPALKSSLNKTLETLPCDTRSSPLITDDPVLPTSIAAHHPLATSSPTQSNSSKTSSSCTERSAVKSRGTKRHRQEIVPEYTTSLVSVQGALPVSQPQLQTDDNGRSTTTQPHCRQQDIFSLKARCMTESGSPQFEERALCHQMFQSDTGNHVIDKYSLHSLCKSLGSRRHYSHLNNEDNQTRTSRRPRRIWKRYTTLFPPLTTTRVQHT